MLLKLLLLALPMVAAAQTPDFFPAKGAENVNPDTHLILKFSDVPTLGEKGFVRVFDAATGEQVDALDLSIPAGPTRGRQYGPECDYMHTPYAYTRTSVPTNKDTTPGTPTCGADPTSNTDYQLTIIGGFTDGFHFYPILIRDSTAIINLHHNLLEYGHEYYVTIDKGVINCGNFAGVKKNEWKFKTKASGPKDPHFLMVNANGTGDFNTVQGALDYVPDWSKERTVINVARGEYEEIVYFRNKSNIVIRGEGRDLTKVHYANCEVFNPHPTNYKTNEMPGTFPSRRAAFTVDNCRDITIEDMYIATDVWGQAEGILVNGERIALYRTEVVGTGDAWQLNGTIYLEGCKLVGAGDSLLGRGSVFAYRCHIINGGGPMAWIRNFKPAHGDVFVECLMEASRGQFNYGHASTQPHMGYPDAEMVIIDCLVRDLNPIGWSTIAMESQTMLEFNTRDADTGELVDTSQRAPLSRQLDAEKDAEILRNYRNPAYVLNGWDPRR